MIWWKRELGEKGKGNSHPHVPEQFKLSDERLVEFL